MKHLIGIYDHNTGEQVVREMTPEEQAERDAEIAAWQKEQEMKLNAIIESEAKKAAALGKLEALGLDADDLKALGL